MEEVPYAGWVLAPPPPPVVPHGLLLSCSYRSDSRDPGGSVALRVVASTGQDAKGRDGRWAGLLVGLGEGVAAREVVRLDLRAPRKRGAARLVSDALRVHPPKRGSKPRTRVCGGVVLGVGLNGRRIDAAAMTSSALKNCHGPRN